MKLRIYQQFEANTKSYVEEPHTITGKNGKNIMNAHFQVNLKIIWDDLIYLFYMYTFMFIYIKHIDILFTVVF